MTQIAILFMCKVILKTKSMEPFSTKPRSPNFFFNEAGFKLTYSEIYIIYSIETIELLVFMYTHLLFYLNFVFNYLFYCYKALLKLSLLSTKFGHDL